MIKRFLSHIWQQASRINDCLFRKGGDFAFWKSQEDMGFSSEQGNQYQPSSSIIKSAFKKLPIGPEDVILDIGCGKGRAMYMMSAFPFGRIEGYDLSGEMVEIANANFTKLGLDDRCHAFIADADTYEDYDRFNYFYAFNPVPEKVFKNLMDHISESIRKNPRTCRFIYLNPMYDTYILDHTDFKKVFQKQGLLEWDRVFVYES